MHKPKTIYTTGMKLSSIIMLLALIWLTVCLPVVYAQQQAQEQQALEQHLEVPEDCNENPLTNTTEEKAGNGINTLSEEYLHHSHHSEYIGIVVKTYYKCHATDLYFAFHPELISPPPNSFLS